MRVETRRYEDAGVRTTLRIWHVTVPETTPATVALADHPTVAFGLTGLSVTPFWPAGPAPLDQSMTKL
jgi:hypothetical protein